MELEIINEKPISILNEATTSEKSIFLLKPMGQTIALRKPNCILVVHPIAGEENQWFLESF